MTLSIRRVRYVIPFLWFLGFFSVGLVACGGDGSGASKAVNHSPVANAGTDQAVAIQQVVQLDASGSTDDDGDALAFSWQITSMPVDSTIAFDSNVVSNPSFLADVEGTFIFELEVSDGEFTSNDWVVVRVLAEGLASETSTADIKCDYSYNAFNDSASINASSYVEWSCSDTTRELTANGIPDHSVGVFPNAGNPNTISEQAVSASITLFPQRTEVVTTLGGPNGPQGYVLNGVKIDAATGGSCTDYGEFCSGGSNDGAWNLEALGHSSFDFGADENNAHVQPDGTYHYHGMPEGFIAKQGGHPSKMTLIAWASDGFPIYARYGYSEPDNSDSDIKRMQGSYQLVTNVSETRPPVDIYEMGTFQQDWVYVEGSGDLDECNGRFGVTPEFPSGIYHYFATDSYPYFQRCVKGETVGGGPGVMRP